MTAAKERSGKDQPRGLGAILSRPAPTKRQLLLGGGHLAALWALAFVQPLLDLLGSNPDFFVARGNTTGDILILAIGFTLLPPLFLLLVEWLVSKLGSKAYYGLHFLLLAVIAAFFFIQLVSDLLTARTAIILVFAAALALLLAWSVFRFVFVKNLMDILIIAPLVILALFLFGSKTTELIFPQGDSFKVSKDSGEDTPIVIMLFDELGTSNLMTDRDSVDRDRFPNFARLAETSTWYKNHSTTAYFTPLAVPGLLTGISQAHDVLPTAEAQPLSIFSQMSHDRPLHVLEPVTAICPEDLCPEEGAETSQRSRLKALFDDLKYVEGRLVLPPGLADRLPDVGSNFEGFGDDGGDGGADPAPATPATNKEKQFVKGRGGADHEGYEQFIRDIPKNDRGLTLMHLHLPHQVWRFDTDGREYNRSPLTQLSESTGQWKVDGNGVATSQERMYVQTGYADKMLRELRSDLERKDLWEKAIVIVTADHGISFQGDGVPQRQTDNRAMGEVANPPLFIKYPGQKDGEVSMKPSQTLDVVPTIAEAVGVKDLYETDGVPLQGPVPERPVTVFNVAGKEFSVEVGEMTRQRNTAITRANRRLGTGPFYTLGPAPELIGRKAPSTAGAAGAALDQPGIWKNYRPGRDKIPMNVTGTLDASATGESGEAPVIAVSVNGVIRGTTRPFDFEGATRFGTLVAPNSLRPGANEIGIYRLQGDELIPLGSN